MRVRLGPMLVWVVLAAALVGCGPGGTGGTSSTTPRSSGPAVAATPVAKRIEAIGGKEWTQVQTDSPLKIDSIKLFFTGLGETAFVIGEVENTGSAPVTNVKIVLKGLHAEGRELDKRDGQAPMLFIPPKVKAPFKIAVDLREVSKLEITITSQPATSVPENKLEIVSSQMGEPKTGQVWVTGEVKNNGGEQVKTVEVVTVLRDKDGKIVEVDAQELLTSLDAGKTMPFKFMVQHREATKLDVTAQAKASSS